MSHPSVFALDTAEVEISRQVRTSEDETGMMLLDLRSGRYISLNGTAAQLWRSLQRSANASEAGGGRGGRADIAGLARELASQHGVSESIVGQDLNAFLSQLEEAGLVTVRH